MFSCSKGYVLVHTGTNEMAIMHVRLSVKIVESCQKHGKNKFYYELICIYGFENQFRLLPW